MTRETRIGLLVGLGFIIMFGLVLSELTGTAPPPLGPDRMMAEDAPYAWTPVTAPPARAPAVPVDEGSAAELAARREGRPAPAGGAREVVRVSMLGAEARAPRRDDVTVRARPPVERGTPVPATREGAEPPRPTTAARRTYTVAANDTLIRIARKVYGRQHEMAYKRIFEANADVLSDESTVVPGQVLKIPPLAAAPGRVRAETHRPGPFAGRTPYVETDLAGLGRYLSAGAGSRTSRRRIYVVRHGDNLTKIARKVLHDGSRAAVMKLFHANKDKLRSPNHLPVGLRLEIPS